MIKPKFKIGDTAYLLKSVGNEFCNKILIGGVTRYDDSYRYNYSTYYHTWTYKEEELLTPLEFWNKRIIALAESISETGKDVEKSIAHIRKLQNLMLEAHRNSLMCLPYAEVK